MTTLTLSKLQRDGLRWQISGAAQGAASGAFPELQDVPEDRGTVLRSLEHAREWLTLLDQIGWECDAVADQRAVDLDDRQLELLRSLEDSVRRQVGYDHRDDDRAVLEALLSLNKAVA